MVLKKQTAKLFLESKWHVADKEGYTPQTTPSLQQLSPESLSYAHGF